MVPAGDSDGVSPKAGMVSRLLCDIDYCESDEQNDQAGNSRWFPQIKIEKRKDVSHEICERFRILPLN